MSTLIFLQADGSGFLGMLPLLLIFVVFWFFIIRPQMKKQKEQNKFGEQLTKGQEVVTAAGILGRINKIEGDIVHLEVATKTYIRVTKSAISKELTESVIRDGKDAGPVEVSS